MDSFRPETDVQVRDFVAWAVAEEAPLEILGCGSKRGLGRPSQTEHSLDLSALRGIDLYEAEELVLSARAGTQLAEVEAALAAKNQALAFEPPDLGPLLGGEAGQGSLGGVIACNLSGPRRIRSGAARDHFLGFRAISGRGEAYKSGGRVVKNVTGYDLSKLIAGSYGTLSVMTHLTVKVLPAAEVTQTVVLLGLETEAALRAMTLALQSSHDVSGAAHLPQAIAEGSSVGEIAELGAAATLIRIEGPPISVRARVAALESELADLGEIMVLEDEPSLALWREVRDVRPFVGLERHAVWRISVPPARGANVAARLERLTSEHQTGARLFLDWGGGLIWLAVPEGEGAGDEAVRATLDGQGHATLIKANAEVRAAVPVFQPQAEANAVLTRRIKDNFDPKGILNPARMYAGV